MLLILRWPGLRIGDAALERGDGNIPTPKPSLHFDPRAVNPVPDPFSVPRGPRSSLW